MLEAVCSTDQINPPTRSTLSPADITHLTKIRRDSAIRLLNFETRGVIALLQRVVNDPLSGDGNWNDIVGDHHNACNKLTNNIGKIETVLTAIEKRLRKNRGAKISTSTIHKLSSAIIKVSQDVEKVLLRIIEDYKKRDCSAGEPSFATITTHGFTTSDEDPEDGVPFVRPLPHNITIADLRESCGGALRYVRSFAHALKSLTESPGITKTTFDLRTVACALCSPRFVGEITVPDQPVPIEAVRDELTTLAILIVGSLNVISRTDEQLFTQHQTAELCRSGDVIEDPLAWIGEPTRNCSISFGTDGTIIFKVEHLSPATFESTITRNFISNLELISECTRRLGLFFIEVNTLKDKNSILVKLYNHRTSGKDITPQAPSINLSGMLPHPPFDLDLPSIALPWPIHAPNIDILISAPDELWQSPTSRRKLAAIGNRGASFMRDIEEDMGVTIDVQLDGSAGNTSEELKLRRNRFSLKLTTEHKSFPFPSPTLGVNPYPRFFRSQSLLTLPAYFTDDLALQNIVRRLLTSTTTTVLDVPNPLLPTLYSPRRRKHFTSMLLSALKLVENSEKNSARIEHLCIQPLIVPQPHQQGFQPTFVQAFSRQDPKRVPPFALQAFDAEGKLLSRYAVNTKGTLSLLPLPSDNWLKAFNNALDAGVYLGETPGLRKVERALSLMGISTSGRILTLLSNACTLGQEDFQRALANEFLHPSLCVKVERRQLSTDDIASAPLEGDHYIFALPGEKFRIVLDKVMEI